MPHWLGRSEQPSAASSRGVMKMGVLDKWRSRLRETNDALAEAHKTWRDERLEQREQRTSEREQALNEREERVVLQLAEMRAIERRQWRRRFGMVLIAALTGLLGFLLGLAVAETSAAPSTSAQSIAPPASSDKQSKDTEQVAGTSAVGGAARNATEVQESTTAEPPSLGACRQRGIAYFKEIGSYPTLNSPPEAGRSADVVAMERCTRSPYAFGAED